MSMIANAQANKAAGITVAKKENIMVAVNAAVGNQAVVKTAGVPLVKNKSFLPDDAVAEEGVQTLVGKLAARMSKGGATQMESMIVAMALEVNKQMVEDDYWEEFMRVAIGEASLTCEGEQVQGACIEGLLENDRWLGLLRASSLIEGSLLGSAYYKVAETRSTHYAPVLASEGVTRRFGVKGKSKTSKMVREAMKNLEGVEFTVSDLVYDTAVEVIEILPPKSKLHSQLYILKGCEEMDSELAYVSEWKPDGRMRLYQAAMHGPQGAGSDLARALMDLHGVSMDYDCKKAVKNLLEEMADMISVKGEEGLRELMMECLSNPVAFLVKCELEDTEVKKHWSFYKASVTLAQLEIYMKDGSVPKPYIGMAFGLDAKCSGIQMAALMTGCTTMLQACGFTDKQVDDAYQRACNFVRARGFTSLNSTDGKMSREGIKTAFMAVFYGQSFAAFMDEDLQHDPDTKEMFWVLYPDGELDEARAKAFHAEIVASFGTKINNLRKKFKEDFGTHFEKVNKTDAHGVLTCKLAKPIHYYMPDGAFIGLEIFQRKNILGQDCKKKEGLSFSVEVSGVSYTYKTPTFATKEYALGEYGRTGFVNLVQAVDALLARCIINNLANMGVKHIISIHDCFRVSITDVDKLRPAINLAYLELFATKSEHKSRKFPKGLDILRNYFDAAEDSLAPKYQGAMVKGSQFIWKMAGKPRRLFHEFKFPLAAMINSAKAYFFAK